eukprot:g29048.t1
MLPLFLAGNSLGGGLAACMVLQRPSFFKGVLLLCPMLTVSDEVKPPWIVQMIFKYVVAHLFPTWPVSPVKDLSDFDFRDPLQGNKYVKVNPMSLQGLTPRLGTSLQLGFIYPDWLKERLSEVRTPFIIQHGLEDRVTDPNTSKELYKEAIAKDKTLKLYDGVYHCEMFCCLPGNEKLLGLKWSWPHVDRCRLLCAVTGFAVALRAFEGSHSMRFGQYQMREAKRKREAAHTLNPLARLCCFINPIDRTGIPPRDDLYWRREERMLFGTAQMEKGINFDAYDEVEVDRRGGMGDEVPCPGEPVAVHRAKRVIGLHELVDNVLKRCGYGKPTPVQKHAVPAALSGNDVMVCAQTGSGKTAAFLVPLIAETLTAEQQKLVEGAIQPSAIIMAPTRELCQQITLEARKLCFRTAARVVAVYGALDFLDPTYLWIAVGRVGEACDNVVQRFRDASTTDLEGKFEMLVEAVKETLVFANSKTTVDAITWRLSDARIRSMQIHGGLSQGQRDRALSDFRNGRVSVLVATDVAARGLDLPGIDHVVNYEMPKNAEDYTHRIGRTGRIGTGSGSLLWTNLAARVCLSTLKMI